MRLTQAVPYLLTLLLLAMAGCKKCVECDIDLKQAFVTVAEVDFCGTSGKIEEEEERLLNSEYACVECVANTSFGSVSSGFHCGNRVFTDSLEDDWRNGGMETGHTVNCTYYRDTLEVICLLKP